MLARDNQHKPHDSAMLTDVRVIRNKYCNSCDAPLLTNYACVLDRLLRACGCVVKPVLNPLRCFAAVETLCCQRV